MLKSEGVLHFTIPVSNLERSEKFYTEILGFEKVGRSERIVFLRAGTDFFNLTRSHNPVPPNLANGHEIHSAFQLTPQSYDEALKLLPVFVGRSAYIHDPDRNVIEFIDLKRMPPI